MTISVERWIQHFSYIHRSVKEVVVMGWGCALDSVVLHEVDGVTSAPCLVQRQLHPIFLFDQPTVCLLTTYPCTEFMFLMAL